MKGPLNHWFTRFIRNVDSFRNKSLLFGSEMHICWPSILNFNSNDSLTLLNTYYVRYCDVCVRKPHYNGSCFQG